MVKIIVLGGMNYSDGSLNVDTKIRLDEVEKICNNLDKNYVLHLSGGKNPRFNKSSISHAELCKEYFISKNLNIINKSSIYTHVNTNSTVEEAIHFGKYFTDTDNKIFIVTNDWHMKRAEYLFRITFEHYNIKHVEFVSVKSDITKNVLDTENSKYKQLIENPYGLWKDWLKTEYYNKVIKLIPIKMTDIDCMHVLSMRNENSEFFFNKEMFKYDTFKEVFYNKYFSNEIQPYFIKKGNQVIGFIGCKTLSPNINDIGIMLYKCYKNKGIGTISLNKFLHIYNNIYNIDRNKILIAKILKNNKGSYYIFKKNNFIECPKNTTNSIYYLYYI